MLLRTEGIEVVADLAPGEQAIGLASALNPDIAIVDVSPGEEHTLDIAWRLRALPNGPTVVVTSSAAHCGFDRQPDGFPFIAKADITRTCEQQSRSLPLDDSCLAIRQH